MCLTATVTRTVPLSTAIERKGDKVNKANQKAATLSKQKTYSACPQSVNSLATDESGGTQ